MIQDILQDLLQGIFYESVFDGKARRNKKLDKEKESMPTSEKLASHIVYYASGISLLIIFVVLPLLYQLQGTQLANFWKWGFFVHFLFIELCILIARAVKKGSPRSLRQIFFIRMRIRPFVMHATRWLPLLISLAILSYQQFLAK